MTHNNLKVQYLQRIKHTFCYVLLWFGNGQLYATYNVSLANSQLEKLERLCSEDTPCCPMIINTIDQFILDPMSRQDKVKVANSKHLPKLEIF